MPLYLYQAAYTPESLAAQIKNPMDRLEVVGGQLKSSGVRVVTGGYSFGDYDISLVMEAPELGHGRRVRSDFCRGRNSERQNHKTAEWIRICGSTPQSVFNHI